MQKIKVDQAQKRKKYDILFTTKYTKPLAHIRGGIKKVRALMRQLFNEIKYLIDFW